MIIACHEKDTYVLNIERGEELFSSLRQFLDKEQIKAGYFTGLGAAGLLDAAYYDLSTKKFERHVIKEDVEILSLVGNIARLGNETIVHVHGTFGKRDLSVFGGHLFRFRCRARVKYILQNFQKQCRAPMMTRRDLTFFALPRSPIR